MKRIVKWAGLVVLVMVSMAVLALACIWGYYRHIVSAAPGRLTVEIAPKPLGSMVNVFSGTGGYPWVCGHDSPAATTPFGMVRLCPDTASLLLNQRGLNRSGYFYGDNKIIGFSHTRLVGADAQEGGLFRVFPSTERLPALEKLPKRFARFSHRDEVAFPGYYAVRLARSGILVELTATPRVGVHRYTFPADVQAHLSIDSTSALGTKRCDNGRVRVLPESGEIEGSARLFGTFSGRYGGLDAYFVARFSEGFQGFSTWDTSTARTGRIEVAGNSAGCDVWFEPRTNGRQIEMRVGLSYVSVENARRNLDTEAGSKSFDALAAEAGERWEGVLSRIRVEGGATEQRRIFYTRLYNAFMMPTTFNDVNGEYMGFDRNVHRADGFTYYTDMSLWDTFRTVHPLYNLIARREQRDMLVSLVEMAKAGGSLPRWPSGAGYTGSMLGSPADIVVAESWLKGVRDFDVESAYGFMVETASHARPEGSRSDQRDGVEAYVSHGYCPSDVMDKSVASTLEYAHADHAIGLLAQALGKSDDAERFLERGQNYRHVWNSESLYFEERDSSGRFAIERNPLVLSYTDRGRRYTRGYVEGSGLQWRWYAPHDAAGLVSLFPSPEVFVDELNRFFEGSDAPMGHWYPGVHYWHGNEPDLHAVYLFNAAGRPDLTRKWARWILEHRYADNYVGLDGNDDGGTLSAWYVFSALGFYPVAGTTRYEIGAPLFAAAELDMGQGTLRIEAEQMQPSVAELRDVLLNGKPLHRTWFDHGEISEGATLRFSLVSD